MRDAVTVDVPASTSNLGPGFDCLGMALDLSARFRLRCRARGVRVRAFGEGADCIPRGPRNLVVRGARHVFERAGRPVPGLDVEIHNGIPMERGLGSSAAALVGGMMGAGALLGLRWSRRTYLEAGLEIEPHPDNLAAAIFGGLTVAFQEGSRAWCRRIPAPRELGVLLAIPSFTVSTAVSRRALPRRVPREDAVFSLGRCAYLVAGLAVGDLSVFAEACRDRLHQPYRKAAVPMLDEVLAAAEAAGALGGALSGSGPTIAIFHRGALPGLDRAVRKVFRRHGATCRLRQARVRGRGGRVVSR